MVWWHSLLAEVFPSWHERRLLRRLQADNETSLEALQKFRRKIATSDPKQSTRDPREDRAPNPKGPAKGRGL